MKKLIACLLSFLFLLWLPTFAEEAEKEVHKSGDYSYVLLQDGTAEITAYAGSSKALEIPSEIDGRKVTGIGDYAFYYCISLTAVTIPDSVTSIGANPFAYCENLKEINVSLEHPYLATIDGVLFSKPDRRLVCYPCAFKAAEYVIPQGTQVIGDHAFDGCSRLTAVTIPDSVTSIGDWAFTFCESLTAVTIPDSVTSVGANPFVECEKLKTISVSPEHPYLATIDGVLFSKPDRRLVCYPCAFDTSEYAIPQGIQIIGNGAFAYCGSLTAVTIPDSVTSIGFWAFSGCGSLTAVIIPDNVTSIGHEAFSGCGSLTAVTIPDSVTSIGFWAFSYCGSLTAVTIPDSVTSIGDAAFYACDSLTAVTVPDSVTFIGEYAFTRCAESLTITVGRDSYALQYCKDNGIRYIYPDTYDWLNG